MTGTRSNPGAGFALGRMGLSSVPRGAVCIQAAIPPILAIEVSFCHPESSLPPLPSDALHMRALCARLFSWYLFLHRRLSALHGGDVSG